LGLLSEVRQKQPADPEPAFLQHSGIKEDFLNKLEEWLIEFDFLLGALLIGVILACVVALMNPDPKIRAAIALGILL